MMGFAGVTSLETLDIPEITEECKKVGIDLIPMEFSKNIRCDLNKNDLLIIYSTCIVENKTCIFPQWICTNLIGEKDGKHVAAGKPIAIHNVVELQQFAHIVTEKYRTEQATKIILVPASDIVKINNKIPWNGMTK